MTTLKISSIYRTHATITKDSISRTDKEICRQRSKRNALLAETDNTMVSDRGLSDSKVAEWKTHRQELRDMDFSDPDNITWPTKPS